MIDEGQTVQPALRRTQRIAAIVAGIGVILAIVGFVVNPTQFVQSYLVAFLYCFGLSLGCLAFLMIHYLAGGRWGAAIGDVLRSAASLFWLVALMFIPIVPAVPRLYLWADSAAMASDPGFAHKALWMSLPVWLGRAVVYFVIWILLAYFLDRWFAQWDRTGDPELRRSLRNLSGAGMVLLFLTGSFAMFDWVMSLEPEWTSTIYGAMVLVGHALAAWAFAIFVLTRLRNWWPVREMVSTRQWQDLGSLLLANVILWAYLSFDQFMLIWVGNLNDQIPWYLKRMTNGWDILGVVVILGQFAIPFLALVLRGVRRNPVALGWVALLLFSCRFLEDIILVEPEFPAVSVLQHWQDLALLLGLGGIWLTIFLRQLRARLVAVRPYAAFPEHVVTTAAPGHPATGGAE
ncbi:MAG TPA: hypothetical protein VFZ25_00435 [Chloroflexota bacterium]|nr:hypothetical protein [Chloroflexota bacterium]